MSEIIATAVEHTRPIPESYWVVAGRFLAGPHPGSRSRAEAMDRLRRFLSAGITFFIDLTEPSEVSSYESLLPFATPDGRRVEYFREPIPDHDVPADFDVMTRIVDLLDAALRDGHVVYVHCRGGIGRSAMVAACWLALKGGRGDEALEDIQAMWQQSSRSKVWSIVPETEEQADFVRDWGAATATASPAALAGAPDDVIDHMRGALFGLALGDTAGAGKAEGAAGWTQHTAMTLCLLESLLERRGMDARDQMQRYLRWRDEGYLSATGSATGITEDVSHALASYQWRGQPMAGSHDPADRTTASLPRVVAAVAFAAGDPAAAVALAGECSRTTHQAPLVIDACRYFAALLIGATRGEPNSRLFDELYEPVKGIWDKRPLKNELLSTIGEKQRPDGSAGGRRKPGDVLQVLRTVCDCVARAASVEGAVNAVIKSGKEPALTGALAGALAGARFGARSIPPRRIAALKGAEKIEALVNRLAASGTGQNPPRGPNGPV
jgi:ADP-ribosylglycohydrolase